jgi:hypothetical protein
MNVYTHSRLALPCLDGKGHQNLSQPPGCCIKLFGQAGQVCRRRADQSGNHATAGSQRELMRERNFLIVHGRTCGAGRILLIFLFRDSRAASCPCVYRKLRFGRIGDEVLRVSDVISGCRRAEPGDAPAHLCGEIDAFVCRCSNWRRSAVLGADGLRRKQ